MAERREQLRGEDRDDGDHHEQLDQGERPWGGRSCFHQVRESKDDAGPSQGRIGFPAFLVTVSISFALGQARCGLCAGHRVWGGLRCGPFDASWLAPVFLQAGGCRAVARLVHLDRGSGRADAVLFYDIPAMTSVRIETH